MTYSLLNLVFLVPALVLWIVAVVRRRLSVAAGLGGTAVLLVLTIIFDNVMILVGLMVYSDSESSGLRIGLMPLEDLAYSLFAAFALPALWSLLTPRRAGTQRPGGHVAQPVRRAWAERHRTAHAQPKTRRRPRH